MTEQNRNDWIADLANRLYILVDPWDREYASPEEMAEQIKSNPLAIIDYLSSCLEEA